MTAARWGSAAPTGKPAEPVAVEQFERHGFVHCCFREQLTEIATWWFDPVEELVVLKIDPSRLRAELRLEPTFMRSYPHVYGPIHADAVMSADSVPRTHDGVAVLPPSLSHPPPAFALTGRLEAGGPEVVVRWRPGIIDGDATWVAAAHDVIETGRLVPLVGGVRVAADLDRAYESFALLVEVAYEIVRYDGDGFFEWPDP